MHPVRFVWPGLAAAGARLLSLPLLRSVRMTRLRRFTPLGYGRPFGTPVVRHYWHQFLTEHQQDIRGIALEIGTTVTIRRYGGVRLERADALDLVKHSPEITLVGDLSRGDRFPADFYDCFVNQFTMHVIDDVESALYHSIRLLKPGGVLLINFPCLDIEFPTGLDMGTGWPMFVFHWFTDMQVRTLFDRVGLSVSDYSLTTCGNLFSRVAHLMNMPAEELTRAELATVDLANPVLICARVVKPASWSVNRPQYRDAWRPDVRPATWSEERGHYSAALIGDGHGHRSL